MKIINVPIFNDDGSIQLTQVVSPEEAQALLQFAINFLTAAGMYQRIVGAAAPETSTQTEMEFAH